MKLWIAMFLVILVILIGGICVERSILKTTDSLSHDLDLLQEHVKAKRWPEAKKLCGEIERCWSQRKKTWIPFIHNHELDTISENLTRIVSLLEGEEQNDALVEIAVVKVRLVQLHHQEVLTLQNIF